MAMPLTSGKVYFSPKQDLHGYSKPWVGGAGKNLLNINIADISTQGIAFGGSVSESGTNGSLILKAGTYTVSANVIMNLIGVGNSNSSIISTAQNSNSLTFTIDEDQPIRILFYKTDATDMGSYIYQLESGSTATVYEPYENICPIEGWDGITVNRTGKNLYSGEQIANLLGKSISQDENGRYMSVGVYRYVDFPDNLFKENTRYTFLLKLQMSTNALCFHIIYTDGTSTSITGTTGFSTTVIVSAENKTIKGIETILRSATRKLYIDETGIFEGVLTANDFESYSGITQTIQFPKTIYGGYVDLVSGEVVETWNSKTIDGTNIQDYAGNGYNGAQCTNRYLTFVPNSSQSYQANTAISNYLESKKYAVWSNANNYPNCFTINGGYQLHICFLNDIVGITSDDSNTVKTNKIKAYLAEHPMQLVYPLKTADMGHYSLTM